MPFDCIALVQARMSSSRLPGKVLRDIAGEPMLGHILRRLSSSKHLKEIFVLSSEDKSDDAVADFVKARGFSVYRGSLEDVLSRFETCLREQSAHAFARVCADSPFYDVKLLDCAIETFFAKDVFLLSSTVKRSFPVGQSMEILQRQVFLDKAPHIVQASDRENVTSAFYKPECTLPLFSFQNEKGDYSQARHVVDTAEDFEVAEKIARALGPRMWEATWDEVESVREEIMNAGSDE